MILKILIIAVLIMWIFGALASMGWINKKAGESAQLRFFECTEQTEDTQSCYEEFIR